MLKENFMYWQDKTPLRTATCFQCQHLADTQDKDGHHGQKPYKSLCEVTKRWGKLARGKYCDKFEYRQWHNATADDGTPIRNRQPEDYRTKRQWEEVGRKIKDGASGTEMYATRNNMKTKYTYYLPDETEEI